MLWPPLLDYYQWEKPLSMASFLNGGNFPNRILMAHFEWLPGVATEAFSITWYKEDCKDWWLLVGHRLVTKALVCGSIDPILWQLAFHFSPFCLARVNLFVAEAVCDLR